MRTRFILILFFFLFLSCVLIFLVWTRENFHPPISLDEINIYAIHKKDMEKRLPRLQTMLQTYFPNNMVEIVEPVTGDYLRNNLSSLYTSGKISDKAYEDLVSNMMVHAKTEHGTMTISALSLYMTNLLIMEKESMSGNQQYIMIVEDDILVREDFNQRFRAVLRHLPADWDILYLACHFKKDTPARTHQDFSIVRMDTRIHGTGAILYHPRSLPILLDLLTPMDLQIDHDIPDKIVLPKKLNVYIALTPGGVPLIHNDNMFYGSSTQITDQ